MWKRHGKSLNRPQTLHAAKCRSVYCESDHHQYHIQRKNKQDKISDGSTVLRLATQQREDYVQFGGPHFKMETLENTYTWLFQTLKCPKTDIVRRKNPSTGPRQPDEWL